MEQRTAVYISCSPHKRTGKSTTARLLTDYFISSGREPIGFDTDPHEPDYARHFGDEVQSVDASRVEGQIAIFDRLLAPDGVPKIVDVWRRSYDGFFETIRQIGFMEEAKARGVEPIVLFHAEPGNAALVAAKALISAWPDMRMIVVANEGACPLGPEALDILGRYPSSRRFVIGGLDGPIAGVLDEPDFSLSRFLLAPPGDMSIVVRAGLRAWLGPIFTQFRSFELRMSMEGAQFF